MKKIQCLLLSSLLAASKLQGGADAFGTTSLINKNNNGGVLSRSSASSSSRIPLWSSFSEDDDDEVDVGGGIPNSPPAPQQRSPASSSSSVSNRNTMERPLEHIFKQNARWVETKMLTNPDYFLELGSTHTPKYLWIGSADARVPANVIMGEDAGSVFVLRNIANLVVNTDVNLMAGIQYAVDYLQINDILVCGHYECGGCRAAETANDHMAPLENWLRNIRDVYRLHKVELDSIVDPEARHRRLVELNVIEQCVNLFKTGCIQQRNLEASKGRADPIRVHPVVFDPKTGILTDLQVDFSEYMGEINSIYGLYES